MDGSTLYRLVEAYERLGVHRAGTGVDRATVDWLEARLRSVGFRTSRTPVPFDRYLVDSKLTADGATIDHLPLAYEWCGSVETTDVAVFDVDIGHGGHTDAVDDAARALGANTSRLVDNEDVFDPHTGIPRMSAIPVAVERRD